PRARDVFQQEPLVSGLDIVVLAIVAVLGLRGLFRGFIREAFAVVAWVGGILLSFLFAKELAPVVADAIGVSAPFDRAIAGVAIFLGVYVVVEIVARILRRIAHAIFLGPVDRVAGLLLGAAKAALLCGLAFWLAVQRFGPETRARIEASPVAAAVLQTTEQALAEISPPPEPKTEPKKPKADEEPAT
ncbi:MAG: CvpA family protein, partial [Candidatus Binatia bacterium]